METNGGPSGADPEGSSSPSRGFEPAVDPGKIEAADLPVVRKGFDRQATTGRLRIAAEEIRRLSRHVARLESQNAELQSVSIPLDEAMVAQALGSEAIKVIESARQAAAERMQRAGDEASETLSTAQTQAAGLRETVKSEAEALIARATETHQQLLAEAAAEAERILETDREQGRRIVAEAQTVRERMLRDLSRKRQNLRTELEQLRTARDWMLEAFGSVQQALDGSIAELIDVVPEAKAAAERAGLRAAAAAVPTVAELEAEIAAARLREQPAVSDLLPESADPSASEAGDTTPGEAEDLAEGTAEASPETSDDTRDEQTGEVQLYDIEAEAETLAESDREAADPAAERVAETASVTAGGTATASGTAGGSAEPAAGSDVADIFDRLRSAQAESAGTGEAGADEPGGAAAGGRVDHQQADPDGAEPGDADPEGGTGDLGEAARALAVSELGRAIKRMLVEQQSEVLETINNAGASGLTTLVSDVSDVPEGLAEVLRAALADYASDVGQPESALDLEAATATVVDGVVVPIRARLRAGLVAGNDSEVLSEATRSLYREFRTRQVDQVAQDAFEAAVSAG